MWQYFKNLIGLIPPPVPCRSGDFVCKLSDNTHYLKDYLPSCVAPYIETACDSIAEYPTTTALLVVGGAASLLYMQCKNKDSGEIALSSGYCNNCGLHSIIHSWLALPEEDIRNLANTHQIFNKIFLALQQFYALDDIPNIDDVIQLNRYFSHPLDREILWGQVFRRTLQNMLCNTDRVHDAVGTRDDEFLADDILGELTQRMGANLRVHNMFEMEGAPKVSYYPANNATWGVNLFHYGNHFDFTLGEKDKNIEHNRKIRARSILNRNISWDGVRQKIQQCLVKSSMKTRKNIK